MKTFVDVQRDASVSALVIKIIIIKLYVVLTV